MKFILVITICLISFLTVHAQHNPKPGKDVLQLQNGNSLKTDILFLSADKYYFTDTTGAIFYLDAEGVSNAIGKFSEEKDFGGYHQNMLNVYNNATVGSCLILGGVALAGFGALISAAFDDSQEVAVPLMAVGGVASLTGFVTLTIALDHGRKNEIKMVAVPYK